MLKKKPFSFVSSGASLLVAGIFIPGFTAMGIIGLQILIIGLGVACPQAWQFLWVITGFFSVFLPFAFINYIKQKKEQKEKLKIGLRVFSLLEYLSIQASLAFFFTKPEVLCYGSGGQNGLEFVFTAWVALPVLLVLNFVFNKVYKIELMKDEGKAD